jgi:hypothetical protein
VASTCSETINESKGFMQESIIKLRGAYRYARMHPGGHVFIGTLFNYQQRNRDFESVTLRR